MYSSKKTKSTRNVLLKNKITHTYFSIHSVKIRALLLLCVLNCNQLHAQVDKAAVAIPEPEMFSRFSEKKIVSGKSMMVATANPYASQAAFDMLIKGGNAVDAAIAASIMLTLTEPNATGIGGGGFLVSFDAHKKQIHAFDGRETAPALATPKRFLLPSGSPMPFDEAMTSGLSVGTPGLLKMLEQVHQAQGKLPWNALFQPTIQQSLNGFVLSDRLHTLLEKDPYLKSNSQAQHYFYDAQGQALPTGTVIYNPDLAKVLSAIAQHGSDVFYSGWIAQDIVNAVGKNKHPGDISLDDLKAYEAKERPILCHPYRLFNICGMPPPSSGTLAIQQMLGLLEGFPMSDFAPNSWQAIHLFSEAGRLAFADRDEYIADPDFIEPPTKGMLDKRYLENRRASMRWDQSIQKALPGKPEGTLAEFFPDRDSEAAGTSHISIIDRWGNAVSLTNTIESQFGSRIMVDGFLLNNQLTDFSFIPEVGGKFVANRIEPNKRPRSSMAPILVFNHDGNLIMNLGSAGGSNIINFVAKTLIGVIDWNLNIQEAISLPNFGSRNRETELEQLGDWTNALADLKERGHAIRYFDAPSGLQGITIGPPTSEGRLTHTDMRLPTMDWVLFGGADPRREGLVLGQ
jgi:gamma-glutamyltranspeptidase/glutathione hydrolase